MQKHTWWQRAVFYQIYPRSFADGNGDGIGDFAGICARLDYLSDLGIDALWLSPHYPSPGRDGGYDISDYTNVAPEYGTLDDFSTFLHAAHARGLRVVLDLVLNHTSDQHPWFVASRAGRSSPQRDWYIWRDGRHGGPPNNWVSIFGGPAWALDPLSGQYYYHAFLKEQPDLNWRNPAVRQAMWQVVRFWLDLGVDGFRLDAVGTIFEHPDLPDHTLDLPADQVFDANRLPLEDYFTLMRYQVQQPGVHELMQDLRRLVDDYPGERVLIGEDEDVAYHGTAGDELHLVFNFPLLRSERLTPAHVRANQALRLSTLPPGAWPCNTLGNHDSPRLWDRFGDGMHDDALARLHLALLLTLKGTPFLYNGEEVGMTNLILSQADELRDTTAVNQYQVMTQAQGLPPAAALAAVVATTRDRCRSPQQWRNAPHAGFCPPEVTPWLPVNPNYAQGVNVADQDADPASLLNFYRGLLHLRRATPALVEGHYTDLDPENDSCLTFLRHDPNTGQRCLVALNFTAGEQAVAPRLQEGRLRVLHGSHERGPALSRERLMLAPFEILIAEVVPAAAGAAYQRGGQS